MKPCSLDSRGAVDTLAWGPLVQEVREGTVDTLANLQRMVESGGLRPRQRAAFAEIVQRGAEMPGEGESPENFSIFGEDFVGAFWLEQDGRRAVVHLSHVASLSFDMFPHHFHSTSLC